MECCCFVIIYAIGFRMFECFVKKKKEFCLNKINKKYVTQRKRDKNKTTFVLSKRK